MSESKGIALENNISVQQRMQSIGSWFANLTIKWFPDAFTFAVLASMAVFIAALYATDHSAGELTDMWYQGFWKLLTFAMQMVLIVVTGYCVSTAPIVQKSMLWATARISTPKAAVTATYLICAVSGFFHWGVTLIMGAFLANAMAQSMKSRGIKVHFPLLVAAAYGGMAFSQTGLSSSGALLVNTPGHFLEDKIGLLPLSETIFQPYSITFVLLGMLFSPFLLAALHPRKEEVVEIPESLISELKSALKPKGEKGPITPASLLNNSRWLIVVVTLTGLVLMFNYLSAKGLLGLDVNRLNFIFLMLGLVLHGSAKNYSEAFGRGVGASSGIILQFPFYAGVLGIMMQSGLLSMIANWFVSISSPETFPAFSMLSAALINFAVPSAGGQWAVQGPIVVEAVQHLGLPDHVAVMTVMMGDQITNMAQPFWLLPILGITGLKVGQVLGYTIILMLLLMTINVGCLFFLI